MTLERLGDFLRHQKPTLQRAYWSDQIKRKIEQRYRESVRVVIRQGRVVIECSSSAQADFLRLKQSELTKIVDGVTRQSLPIRLRVVSDH